MPSFKSTRQSKVGRTGRGGKATPQETAPVARNPKPSKLKHLLLWLLMILIVMLSSVGATLYFTWPASASLLGLDKFLRLDDTAPIEVVAPIPAPSATPLFASLDNFTVSISDGGRTRAFHVAITTQVADDASLDLLTQYSPIVRDRVLRVLSEQHPKHVQTPTGRAQLVDALIISLSAPFDASPATGPRIKDVLFTAFVIQ